MNHNKQTQKIFCTTREAANLLSVSLRTAQLWVENGLLEAWKTEGGHRRILRKSVDQLLVNSAAIYSNAPFPPQPLTMDLVKQEQTSLNILVVEDDQLLRKLYELKLKNWDLPINMNTAHDGYEAMILIGHVKPDLLILDLQMPGMDGFRLLKTLKNMQEFKTIRIVVVSGLDAETITSKNRILGDVLVLPKPIPFDQLQTIAQEMLAQRATTI